MEHHRHHRLRADAGPRPARPGPRPLPLDLPLHRPRPADPAGRPRRRRHVRRRPHLGQPRADQLPARRVRQAGAGHLLRRLPRREPRADRQLGLEGRAVPPARTAVPAADPPRLGRRHHGDGRPARPRLVAAVLRTVRRHDVGRHRAGRLAAARARPLRVRRLRVVPVVRPRADARRHLARPVVAVARRGLPDRAGAVRADRRRAGRNRPRARQPQHRARGAQRLHLQLDRRGARSVRRGRGDHGVPADDRCRPADRPAHREHVREAARRRPHDDPRRAGLHHHRRRHAGRSADGHHAAVRQLRRLVAAVQLHPAGAADPPQ